MHRKFGKNDLLFLGILGLACLAIWIVTKVAFQEKGASVVITVDGREYGRYDLDKEQTIEIQNSRQKMTNVLEIRQGEAKMVKADCPDKLCMHQKAISVEKENIVCLPNRVVVTVLDGEKEGLDGFAQ